MAVSKEVLVRLKKAIDAKRTESQSSTGPHFVKANLDCEYRGSTPLETVECKSCSGKVNLKIYSCSIHGKCTLGTVEGIKSCKGCSDKRGWPIGFDSYNLWPGQPGLRFNPSIMEWPGGYALAYRTGWKGSDIYVGRLDAKFRPYGDPVKLELHHSESAYGREDPRLFVHRNKLHVAFTGVVGSYTRRAVIRHTSVLYARLGANFQVEALFHPHYKKREMWEKNHSYFEHEDRLYCVYWIAPHRVLEVSGNTVDGEYQMPFSPGWTGESPHGGASPVRVGDELWHFCHNLITQGKHKIYQTLLYTFEAKPPFRPLRKITEPLQVANPKTKPKDQYASVVWLGGIVRDGDWWVAACGIHDRFSELHRFLHSELEKLLRPV